MGDHEVLSCPEMPLELQKSLLDFIVTYAYTVFVC